VRAVRGSIKFLLLIGNIRSVQPLPPDLRRVR
jgi:hypothetical protein